VSNIRWYKQNKGPSRDAQRRIRAN
jgi:hypothetical protein